MSLDAAEPGAPTAATPAMLPVAGALYVVIEPVGDEDLREALYDCAEDPEWAYLFTGTDWQPYQSHGPLVVRTSLACSWFGRAWQSLEQGRCLGLVLLSTADFQTVCQWLRRRLVVRFGDRRQGLLRYYDPAVWHRLAPAVGKRPVTIERAWYWHEGPSGPRWYRSVRPEPLAAVPEPVLSDAQCRALGLASGGSAQSGTDVPEFWRNGPFPSYYC